MCQAQMKNFKKLFVRITPFVVSCLFLLYKQFYSVHGSAYSKVGIVCFGIVRVKTESKTLLIPNATEYRSASQTE